MIEAAEKSGKLQPDSVLVEATSGNTGIALAFVCAAKGYKLILTMPESMSLERKKMLKFLGAELELTPAAKRHESGAIERLEEILANNPKALAVQQFKNLANPEIHRRTTAEEVWRDTGRQGRCVHHGRWPPATPLPAIAQVLKTASPGVQDHRHRAGRFAGALRRQARPAQARGHRRRFRAGYSAEGVDRRNHHHRQPDRVRHSAQSRQARGHSRGHFFRRDDCRRARKSAGSVRR